jgi:thiosulfate reductase cytochrome b subunit
MPGQKPPLNHPWPVRLAHWAMVLAVLMMVTSGWRIYNASPLFSFRFPDGITLGGWLAGALLWHFAAMWLLFGSLALYLVYGIASGRFRRRLFPVTPRAVVHDLGTFARGRLSHENLAVYNAVQRLAYLVAIIALVVVVLSGLSIWKPVQLQTLAALFGGYEGARIVHFCAMSTIVAFAAVHVVMALSVPKSLLAMIRGR